MKSTIVMAIAIGITAIASAGLVYVAKVNPVTEKIVYETDGFGVLICNTTYQNGALEIYWGYTGVFKSNSCIGVVHVPLLNISHNGSKYPVDYLYVPVNESENSSVILRSMANSSEEHTWSCYIRIVKSYIEAESYLDGVLLGQYTWSKVPSGANIGLSALDHMGIIYGTLNQNDIPAVTVHGGRTEYSVTLSTIKTATWFEKQTNGSINTWIN
jgi:hypothetical protein